MNSGNRHLRSLVFYTILTSILSFSGSVLATDDGARAYWKARDGTNVVSFQYLNWNIQGSGTQQFAPGQYIYPNSDVEANIFIATWVHHMTLLDRPSSLAVNLAGGDVDVDVNINAVPLAFLPPSIAQGLGGTFSQSSSGFTDPSVQLVVNLFGAPPLKSVVDLLNYEPTWTLDAAALLAFPIGKYDSDKLVNIGQNRWYGRIALPFKYHFGAFVPGHRTSVEVTPSVWLFAENGDFLGNEMRNDPLWQLEGHLTHDFTADFFGSLDLLYRRGFQSDINGIEVGDELDVGNLGFTLNYQVTDNFTMRGGYSSNMFGDEDLDNGILRIQFVYGWHPSVENTKKLEK